MEQWEAIRRLAREKRSELRLKIDDDSAIALIGAAEEKTNIKCRPVGPDDPLLSG